MSRPSSTCEAGNKEGSFSFLHILFQSALSRLDDALPYCTGPSTSLGSLIQVLISTRNLLKTLPPVRYNLGTHASLMLTHKITQPNYTFC